MSEERWWPSWVKWSADTILSQAYVNPTYSVLVEAAYIIQEGDDLQHARSTTQHMGGQIKLLNRLVVHYAGNLFPEKGDDGYDPGITDEQAASVVLGYLLRYARENPRGRQ